MQQLVLQPQRVQLRLPGQQQPGVQQRQGPQTVAPIAGQVAAPQEAAVHTVGRVAAPQEAVVLTAGQAAAAHQGATAAEVHPGVAAQEVVQVAALQAAREAQALADKYTARFFPVLTPGRFVALIIT